MADNEKRTKLGSRKGIGGRPAIYLKWITPEGLGKIRKWAEEGLYDQTIAKDKIGIGTSTFIEWKNQFPELVEALNAGRDKANSDIENAVFKSAMGFVAEDEKTEIVDGPGGRTIKKTILKRVLAPNMTAAIFWLKNRCSDRWADVYNGKVEGEIGIGNSGKMPPLTINYDYRSPKSDIGMDDIGKDGGA